MKISRKDAAKHLLRLRAAEDSYLGYIKLRYPDFELTGFQQLIILALDLAEKGQLKSDFIDVHVHGKAPDPEAKPTRNLLITMPPRHGKSTFATEEFPAYFMLRKDSRFTMSCSYNSELATGFGRKVREAVNDPMVKQAFPSFQLSKESRAADVWGTTNGGKYFGVGLGGTTTGRPANLLIIDDPIKSREEAESQTMRNKVWDYYVSSLASRRQPDRDGQLPITIVILTRWHPGDLAGKLMQTKEWGRDEWVHLNFKAIETDENGLEQPLWPERFPLEYLHGQKELNPRDFEALYQQNPYVQGGNLLKEEWWRYYDKPEDEYLSVIIAADTAFKAKEINDFSVMIVGALTPGGDIHILDIVKGRWEFPELKQRLISLNTFWRGRGLRGIHIEDKASGQSLIQELRRTSGMAIIPRNPGNKDKVSRVNAITDLIAGGRVFLPKNAHWLDDFIAEATAFPSVEHDDQVDAFEILIDALSRVHVTPASFDVPINTSHSLANQYNHQKTKSAPDVDDGWGQSFSGKSLSVELSGKKWKGWGL